MRKFLILKAVGIPLGVLALCFAFLFSSVGNQFLAQILLEKLQNQTNLLWQVRSFKLTPSKVELDFATKDNQLEFFFKGVYSLFLWHMEGNFSLLCNGLDFKYKNTSFLLAPNTWIEGNITGNFKHYTLQAQSNFLNSQSQIQMTGNHNTLHDFSLQITNASLASLLNFLKNPEYGDGVLTLQTQIAKFDKMYNGDFELNIEGGELEPSLFLEHFNLKIPNTIFMGDLKGTLKDNKFHHQLNLYSNNGDIKIQGATHIHSLATNSQFDIRLGNLTPFSAFLNIPLGGNFATQGIIKGDFKNMLVDGNLNFLDSALSYNILLESLKPKTLKAQTKTLNAQSLFKLFGQPAYISGDLNLSLDLRDFSEGISGIAKLKGQKLLANSSLIKEQIQIGIPTTSFHLDSQINLAKGSGILNYILESNLINLKSQESKITLSPFNVQSDFEVLVNKLQNFFYQNHSVFNGDLQAKGSLKDFLTLEGHIIQEDKNPFLLTLSKQALTLRINQLHSNQFYRIFNTIPRYFSGTGNLTFKENFSQKTQDFQLDLKDFQFNNIPLTKNINTKAKINLNKEHFSGYFYNTISGQTLQSRIQLQSKNYQLQTSKITTDLNTQDLEGNLSIKTQKTTKTLDIKGKLHKPVIHIQSKL